MEETPWREAILMERLNIAFGLGSYLPRTYTWVHNQLRFLPDTHVLIMARLLDKNRGLFPVGSHELFSFPKLRMLEDASYPELLRRIISYVLMRLPVLETPVFTRKARRAGCRLVHGHFAFAGWQFMPVALNLGVPLVVSFYGYDYERVPNMDPKWRKRYEELYKHASLFLTEGEHGRKALIEKGVPPDRVLVHRLGVDVDSIPFVERSLQAGEPLRLVQAASFFEKKGHRVLLEALGLLKDRGMGSRVSVTLIGDGPLKPEIVSLAERKGLGDLLKFSDHVPYDRFHSELLKYHAFIHPSRTTDDGDCEGGAPVVLLDAQATGMPVISTTHCDIPEEVRRDQTGLLVPEDDPGALAGAIEGFISHPGKIGDMGKSARAHVETSYSARKQSMELAKVYRNLLENGGKAK